MNRDYYEQYIQDLESEIKYLRELLNQAGIPYKFNKLNNSCNDSEDNKSELYCNNIQKSFPYSQNQIIDDNVGQGSLETLGLNIVKQDVARNTSLTQSVINTITPEPNTTQFAPRSTQTVQISTQTVQISTQTVKNSSQSVDYVSLTPQHASFFYSIFKGRKDVYAKRSGKPNPKTGKTGYYTQCWNFWKNGICPKCSGKIISCNECPNQQYKELKGRDILAHLQGGKADCSDVIGLYAMFPDETCNFLIFDFDNHNDDTSDDGANIDDSWISEVNAMRVICKTYDVPIVVERSRSGKGAHIWIFFKGPISAELARLFGSLLLTKGAEIVNLKNFKFYDRMIPTQDHLPKNQKTGKYGLGNLVALPLQGQALKKGNSAFIDENWNVYPDQWQILRSVIKIDEQFVKRKIEEWGGASNMLGVLSTRFINDVEDFAQFDAHSLSNVNALIVNSDINANTSQNNSEISKSSKNMAKTNEIIRTYDIFEEQLSINSLTFVNDNNSIYSKKHNEENCLQGQKPWEKFVSLFNKEDVQGVLNITLADKVYIDVKNVKPRMQNMMRRLAAFSNPVFYKKKGMGYSTQGVPRIIFCGYDDCGFICLPRALIEPLELELQKVNIDYHIYDVRYSSKEVNVSFVGSLYEEQQRATDAMLKYENGILAATTSFGKTVVGAYMIAKRKTSTLILVHNTEILKNWEEDLEKFLDINEPLPQYLTKTGIKKTRKSLIGTIFHGHNSLTGIIDIAMFSSLGKLGEINPIVEQYGMVIMDECHHGAAQTVEDVIGSVRAKYVYGLTATPKRDDGLERKVYMQFGPIRFRYTAKERAMKQGIAHYIFPRFTRLVSVDDLKINEAYQAVIACDIRNKQIASDVELCIEEGRTPIVLTKYKAHTDILYQLLKDKADYVFVLQGGKSNKQKDDVRKSIRNVPKDRTVILIAIDKYIGEGFNFPRLDTLMLAMPVAWEGNIEQFAGRLHRDYDTKRDVIIYDYIDAHIRVLEKMYHKRMRAYKKIGYDICNTLMDKNYKGPENLDNSIFDSTSYYSSFNRDIQKANSEIIISSPGINRNKVVSFINLIESVRERNVKIIVVTLNPDNYPNDQKTSSRELISMLIQNGIHVIIFNLIHNHFAIIDNQIVWYGSMNFLSKEREDDNLIRVNSENIALELKDLIMTEM